MTLCLTSITAPFFFINFALFSHRLSVSHEPGCLIRHRMRHATSFLEIDKWWQAAGRPFAPSSLALLDQRSKCLSTFRFAHDSMITFLVSPALMTCSDELHLLEGQYR